MIEFWKRYEKYIFLAAILLNIAPVFWVEYFFTGDGPAHLYNANLISQLLENPEGRVSDFFSLRDQLIPNLGGHALLVFFNSFLPASLAEKLVYALCLGLLPIAFRFCIRSISTEQILWCYFVFPLSHNFCFYIGFQSFCLGLALMFFSIGLMMRFWASANIRNAMILGFAVFLTAFFHLFAAILCLLVIGAYLLFKKWTGEFWKRLIFTILALIPTMWFCLDYLISGLGESSYVARPFLDSLSDLLTARILITRDYAEKPLAIAFAILVGFSLAMLLLKGRTSLAKPDHYFMLLSSIVVMILYFIFPDEMASGGYISFRLLLCFFLLFTLWLALSFRKTVFSTGLMVALIALQAVLVTYHYSESNKLSRDAVLINLAAAHIPEGSTVLPLNYSPHWLQYNIGLYPGGVRDLIVLDNYEAMTNHFPVVWNEDLLPKDRLGDFANSKRPLLTLDPYETETNQQVDAVIRWKYSESFQDSSTVVTNAVLNSHFRRVYLSEGGEVEVHLRNGAQQ